MAPLGQAASVAGLLTLGTITSLFAKIVYELKGAGRTNEEHFFMKPWAMTTVMFAGMTFCLPAYYLEVYLAQGKTDAEEQPALQGLGAPLLAEETVPDDAAASQVVASPSISASHGSSVWLLLLPTSFDLIATVLMNIGLLWVTASVYQMMRGAELLFAAMFAVLFLGRRQTRYHLGGITCCIGGIVLVGVSSVAAGPSSSSSSSSSEHGGQPADGHTPVAAGQMLVGMGLIILSQAVQAAQVTCEDFFMADLHLPPLLIVGYEGLFGLLLMLGLMLPVVAWVPGAEGSGLHEDSVDTLAMLRRNPHIACVVLIDCAALALYNIAGMSVTGHLGAVFRTVLETLRTLFVWLVDLALFYLPLGLGTLGESWTSWSWLQLAGFGLLVAGTLVYREGDLLLAAEQAAEGQGGAAVLEDAEIGQEGRDEGAGAPVHGVRRIGSSATDSNFPSRSPPAEITPSLEPGRTRGQSGLATSAPSSDGSFNRQATPVSVPRPAGGAEKARPVALRPPASGGGGGGSIKSTLNLASSVGTPSYGESLIFGAMSRQTGAEGSLLRTGAAQPGQH